MTNKDRGDRLASKEQGPHLVMRYVRAPIWDMSAWEIRTASMRSSTLRHKWP